MSGKDLYNQRIIISIKEDDTFDGNDAFFPHELSERRLSLRRDENRRFEVEALEYLVDPVKLCSVLCMERFRGEF